MGKKGGAKGLPNSTTKPQNPISLREEATGKLHKAGSNVKSMLKLEHLKNLAVASFEVSIPSLGAFYGQCFASAKEAMVIPPDPSLITCERCEIVLHPGFNCIMRIEKKRTKRKKFANVTQNNVVYKCHYCLYQNLKNGTFKGHMKAICPAKKKSSKESKHGQVPAKHCPAMPSPPLPLMTSGSAAFDGSKRKRYILGSNKASEPRSMSEKRDAEKASCTSSKRRKSWTSLNEIAQSSEHNSRIAKLSIPFIL